MHARELEILFGAQGHPGSSGLMPTLTMDQLKQAYRARAMEHHPDRQQHLDARGRAESEARFKQLTLAYDTLRAHVSRTRHG